MNLVANKSFRKAATDLELSTVVALAKADLTVGRVELVARLMEMIDEEGWATVRDIVAVAKESGWTRAEINLAIDMADEDPLISICDGAIHIVDDEL